MFEWQWRPCSGTNPRCHIEHTGEHHDHSTHDNVDDRAYNDRANDDRANDHLGANWGRPDVRSPSHVR